MTIRNHGSLLIAVALWLVIPAFGCSNSSGPTAKPTPADAHRDAHATAEHSKADHAHATEHDHGKVMTEQEMKLPDSFAAGVAQLKELHQKIDHLIEHGELGDVHAVAEQMANVARKMKELAPKEISDNDLTAAGRLCNEMAAYFKPIDEAADAGKKDETVVFHKQMGATISKLEALKKR